MAPDPVTSDLTDEERDFLATMYKSMWDNINRHITAAGQAVGVLSTAFLAALLIKGDALTGAKTPGAGQEIYGGVIDFLGALIVLAAGWTAAHAFDASLWFNRNIQILSNIEHLLLSDPAARRVHPYIGVPRPNKVEGNLQLQVFLAAAIAVITLLIHGFIRHVTFHFGEPLMFPESLPFFAGVIALGSAMFVWRRSVDQFRGFPDVASETRSAPPAGPGGGAPAATRGPAPGMAGSETSPAAEPGSTSPLVYLCGSIGTKSFEEALEWRRKAAELLAPEFAVLSPLREYDGLAIDDAAKRVFDPRETAGKYTDAEIVSRDLRDIRRCQLVLRHYTGPSEGSPMECVYAKQFDIPVVVSGIDDPATASPWLRYHSVKVLPTLEEAVDYIKRYWL
jgi:hypothetical protein